MKKKIITIVSIVILIILTVIIGLTYSKHKTSTDYNDSPSSNSENTNNNKKTTTKKKNDKNNDETEENINETIPEWTKMETSLNDQAISLPITYKDFEKTGYKVSDFREGDRYDPGDPINGITATDDNGNKVYLIIENTSDTECGPYDCQVVSVKIDNQTNNGSYVFPLDIKLGMSYDEVVKKLGNPTDGMSPNETVSTYEWNINDEYYYTLTCDGNDIVTEIALLVNPPVN